MRRPSRDLVVIFVHQGESRQEMIRATLPTFFQTRGTAAKKGVTEQKRHVDNCVDDSTRLCEACTVLRLLGTRTAYSENLR